MTYPDESTRERRTRAVESALGGLQVVPAVFPGVAEAADRLAQAHSEVDDGLQPLRVHRSEAVAVSEQQLGVSGIPVSGLLISWRKIAPISQGNSAHGGPSTESDIAAQRSRRAGL